MKISMPPQETFALQSIIDKASVIIEYGSGGSTIYAGESKATAVITTENDKEFLQKVVDAYNTEGPPLYTAYVYLGETKMWGYPINREHVDDWHKYPKAPWEIAQEKNLLPDTVIVDGRLRVASFVYSIGMAAPGTTIFFDDYLKRKEYHVVEKFIIPDHIVGRAAIFTKRKETLQKDLFEKYCKISR